MNSFLIVFVALLGLSLAEDVTIKVNLLQRLNKNEQVIIEASLNFTARGYDYFAESLNKTLAHVRSVRADVERIPDNTAWKDASKWIAQGIDIDRELPHMLQYPVETENHKSDALYLAIVKTAQRDISLPSPSVLLRQVSDVIIQEGFVRALNLTSTNAVEIQKAQANLDYMYSVLLNILHQKTFNLPTPTNLKKFEAEVKAKIENLTQKGKNQEAIKIQVAYDVLLATNYKIGKIFPLDSQTRYNEFLVEAPEFYRNYQHVNDLMLYLDIDCSGNKCKKPNRSTD